jgi:hypothetical protein
MDKHEPWRPKIKNAPMYNPFEPSTEWTAELGANDRIELEDEEGTEEAAAPNPPTEKTGDK